MVGAAYAPAQILEQTIIYVSSLIKYTIKNASNLHFKSSTHTIQSILSNFPIDTLMLPLLSVYVVEE